MQFGVFRRHAGKITSITTAAASATAGALSGALVEVGGQPIGQLAGEYFGEVVGNLAGGYAIVAALGATVVGALSLVTGLVARELARVPTSGAAQPLIAGNGGGAVADSSHDVGVGTPNGPGNSSGK